MKKIGILLCILFLTGCTNISKLSYDDMVEKFATVRMAANIYRTGYKYYLPDGMNITDSTLYNETIKDNEYTYVPCYMFWNVSSEFNSPFMLINAIDGSIVKIEDNLAGYPAGWLKSE